MPPGLLDAASGSLDAYEAALHNQTMLRPGGPPVLWHLKGAWLLQERLTICGPGEGRFCGSEYNHAVALLVGLCVALVLVFCVFSFLRDDKEDEITPLCPQLLVKDADLAFTLPIDGTTDSMTVTDATKGQAILSVVIEWPTQQPNINGVAANVKLLVGAADNLVATVVARNMAGHGLALCRQGCEIFGFVEPDGPRHYNVRHRTGVHLLTLSGTFGPRAGDIDIEGVNPKGVRVCSLEKHGAGAECTGRILENVDAGLVVASLLATYVHRRLLAMAPPQASLRDPMLPDEAPA